MNSVAEKLLDKTEISQETIREFGDSISVKVKSNQLQVIDLVKELNPALTNGDNSIRLRGVLILSRVITSLPKEMLSAKEIEVLQEFLNLRLVDHKSMELPVLRCLSYFVGCNNKPEKFNKNLLEFLKTKANVHKMDNKSRLVVYEICKKIVLERRSKLKTIDSDLLYSVIHMIEGENNPQNLMISFSLVSYIMKNFDELEPYIDDLFEWLASYYPIDYTPKDSEGGAIRRTDLVDALEECFFANPLNAENLQTLLLEKLESSPTPFKVESLKALTKCYRTFPLESIKDYSSSLWTSVRMNCLKKIDSISPDLLSASYEALTAMTSKLSSDRELYMRFVIDLYEELAIAFRKPEMDLFEPAASLVVHAALPRPDGFDYILDKILPISLNAIRANELRPVPGLVYLFDQLFNHHKNMELKQDIRKSLSNIILSLDSLICSDVECLKLVNSIVRNRVSLDQDILDSLRVKLLSSLDTSSLDIEESLALIDISYKPSISLENELKFVDTYKQGDGESHAAEFSIYLRRIILVLNVAPSVQLTGISPNLGIFLDHIRQMVSSKRTRTQSTENVGQLHAIVLNKLTSETVNSLLMDFFQSEFCQKLIPASEHGTNYHHSSQTYIPVIKWVLKSLVLRNHQLVMPMMNLLLNFLSSDNVDGIQALTTCSGVFRFALDDTMPDLFKRENHYQVFALYKQKFYTQASKEIKIRIGSDIDATKKHVMVCLLALQIPYLPMAAYKKDSSWLVRELLKILQLTKDRMRDLRQQPVDSGIVCVIYDCLSSFISGRASKDLQNDLSTIVNLSLSYACDANSLEIRRKALSCLTEVAKNLDEKELIPLRAVAVDRLRLCLSDKKRLVRQEAAAARLRWVLVGQPVG